MITGPGFRWARRIGLTVLSLIVAFPVYAMLTTAFEPLAAAQASFAWLPRHLSLSEFADMWTSLPLGRYLTNSLIVSTASTVLALGVAIPAAYAIARYRFVLRGLLTGVLLATQAVPGLLFVLPLFLIYAQLQRVSGVQLIGSYPGLVLTDLTFGLPLSIWLLADYFAALPAEIEEAAALDGAGPIRVLSRIVVPTAGAGIAAVATFTFALAWGEVLFATVLTDDRTRTLAVGLSDYAGSAGTYWNQLMAAALVAAVPVVGLFLVVRRLLLTGLRPAPAGGGVREVLRAEPR